MSAQTIRKIFSVISLAAIASVTITGYVASKSSIYNIANSPAPLDVVINEVAWAGTIANPGHQWIELMNRTNFAIDLSKWKITDESGASIDLSGSIAAKGYYLIESKSKATSEVSQKTFPESFTLNTSGNKLKLIYEVDKDIEVIDTANSNGGDWPAGENTDYRCSMERKDFSIPEVDTDWSTNNNLTTNGVDDKGNEICGTPGKPNSTIAPTQTPTRAPTTTGGATTYMSVIINEVAWMGTISSKKVVYPDDEWIELYNTTNNSINVTGWTIKSDDNKAFIITLTGEIPAGGYYLIERGDDNVISNISANLVTSWPNLSNAGQSLSLYNPAQSIVDRANRSGLAWPAGNATTTCSMERAGYDKADASTSWFTSAGGDYTEKSQNGDGVICGSPGRRNWAYKVTATPVPSATKTPVATPTKIRSSIALNEFITQPREDYNGDGRINRDDSYVEIINLSDQTVSLDGWKLDDQPFDSEPYTIGNIDIKAQERMVFFSKDTGIYLSSDVDSVRLYKNNNALVDAYTYTFMPQQGVSWCRYEDGMGSWIFGCKPTPGEGNIYIKPQTTNSDEINSCSIEGLPDVIQFSVCQFDHIFSNVTIPANWLNKLPIKIDLGDSIFIIE